MEPTVPVPEPATPQPAARSLVPAVILAGIAVALVMVGILLLQVLNRPGSAQDVAVDFVVAVYEGDAERACLLTGPEMRQAELDRFGAGDCAEFERNVKADGQAVEQRAADVEVLDVHEAGDRATVRVSAPSGTPGVWTSVDMERLDEEWLVTGYSG